MPRTFRLLVPLLCLACSALAQSPGEFPRQLQSAAFGGGTMTDGGTMYWSLGEMSTATLQSGNSALAQGFWQISAFAEKTETVQSPGPLEISCFPNPVGALLTVNWTDETRRFCASLYDPTGRLLETANIGGGTHQFDFSSRSPGAYLLRFDDETGAPVQSFKLQKQP
jgi:hypothetical protein